MVDLSQSQVVVVSRILRSTEPIDFIDAMAGQPVERFTEVAEDFHEKGFHLELQSAHRKAQGGDLAGAMAAVQKVVAGSSSAGYVEVRFNATLQLVACR